MKQPAVYIAGPFEKNRRMKRDSINRIRENRQMRRRIRAYVTVAFPVRMAIPRSR